MDDEIKPHKQNATWELVKLQPNRKAVGSRWVFKIKQNEIGEDR